MKPFRSFKFSIRTVLIVVAVLGIAMGWTRLQYKRIAERKQFLSWLTAGYAEYNSQVGHYGHYYLNGRDNRAPAPWNLRLFGELGVSEIMIYRPSQTTYPEEQIRKLFPEADLIILRPRRSRGTRNATRRFYLPISFV